MALRISRSCPYQVANKMRIINTLYVIFAVLMAAAPVWSNESKLIHLLRFSDYESVPVEDWLQGKGFQFKEDAKQRDSIDLDVGEKGLILEAKRHAFGVMPNESVNVPEFTYVEIDWGVNKFPEGASYEQGVRNEAIMVFLYLWVTNVSKAGPFLFLTAHIS